MILYIRDVLTHGMEIPKSYPHQCPGWAANADLEALGVSTVLGWDHHFGELSWSPYASFDIECSVNLLQSTSKPVLMMTQHRPFSFTVLKDLQAKILGIPYKNNDLSMFVLLPNDVDGLEKVSLARPCSCFDFRRLCISELSGGAWKRASHWEPSGNYFCRCVDV